MLRRWLYRVLGISLYRRVNNVNPSDTLPCAWCKRVSHTTESTVWCDAAPEGRLVRLCRECGEATAAG